MHRVWSGIIKSKYFTLSYFALRSQRNSNGIVSGYQPIFPFGKVPRQGIELGTSKSDTLSPSVDFMAIGWDHILTYNYVMSIIQCQPREDPLVQPCITALDNLGSLEEIYKTSSCKYWQSSCLFLFKGGYRECYCAGESSLIEVGKH